ncbi:RHS repeat domain-containing protein [Bdellovibrio sp. HCB-162]|uniref:RHS repeat domain-containing protein n=1 Tax=Bdellovibrio sp. HCB-162 TaxID=3394234 RepID=UPI0039BC36A4
MAPKICGPGTIPISSNYPGQCSPGVISDRLSGFSVINLSTRTFTEEIPIPGAPFTLVYNSSHYISGGPVFPPDHVVGGWVYSLDSFYDRRKNTIFYGSGAVHVLSQVPNLETNGKFALMDASGETYTVYTPLDGKFFLRRSELNSALVLDGLNWDDKSFAGFADSFGHKYFKSKDGKYIIGSSSEVLATLSYFSNGKLESVTLPNGAQYLLTYNNEGRLSSFKRPLGKTSYFEYDSEGYLLKDVSSSGRSLSLQAAYDQKNHNLDVVSTNGSGAKKSMSVYADGNMTYRLGFSDFGGSSVAITTSNTDTSKVVDMYAGVSETQMANSAKWGWEVKYASQETFKAGSILLKKQEEQRKNGDVLVKTVVLQSDSRKKYESYTVTKPDTLGSFVITPMQRRYTQMLNEKGQPTMQIISKDNQTVWAEAFDYDTAGNLTSYKNTEGTTVASFNYNKFNLLEKVTDGLGNSTDLSYDNMRRISKVTYPTGSVIEFTYDLEGNLTGVKPPGKPFHNFEYKLGDSVSAYYPPLSAQLNNGIEYRYDNEDRVSEILVGGTVATSYKYGVQESRLFEVRNSHATVGISYAVNENKKPTDLISSLVASDGVRINYSYLWKLPVAVDTQGPVSSSIRYKYNADATLASIDVAGADGKFFSYALGYDLDGLPIKVGSISFVLDTVGRVQGSSQGVIKGQTQYNLNGYVVSDAYSVNGKAVTNLTYSRDSLGRVSTAASSYPSQKSNYSYDKLGRLISVQSGNGIREYSYDDNGNRLSFKSGAVAIKGEYDDQDRLISYGQNKYAYSKFGNLAKVEEYVSPSQQPRITEYDYDSVGNLRAVKLPDGRLIEYVIDGQNRRIGKKINGKLVQGFIFQSQYQIAAETDGSGKIIRRFVYGSKFNIPDYVVTGGKEYRIISDQVGTPKIIVEAATGKIVESLNYDEFGISLDGKHSAYLPFGFAGGVNDRDTKLVRFGARDYDPQTGRWTNRDPILFVGGQANLYLYAYGDPVNYVDPTGHFGLGGAFVGAVIGGIAGGIGTYVGNPKATKQQILNGAFVGAISGGVAGFGGGLFSAAASEFGISAVSTAIGSGIMSSLFGFTGNILGQQIVTGKVDFKQAIASAALAGIGGGIAAGLGAGLGAGAAMAIDVGVGISLMPVDMATGLYMGAGSICQ